MACKFSKEYSEECPIRETCNYNGEKGVLDLWVTIDYYNQIVRERRIGIENPDHYFDKDGNKLYGYVEKPKPNINNIAQNNNAINIPRYKALNGEASLNLEDRNKYIQFEKNIIPTIIICVIITLFINGGWVSWFFGIGYIIHGLWREWSILSEEHEKAIEFRNKLP